MPESVKQTFISKLMVERLVILGGPGAGKGTQARYLGKQLKVPVISIGDILRQSIAAQSQLGLKAQPYVEKRELLADNIMIQFVRQRLLQPDVQAGWVVEGYPRTAFQAEELDFLLDDDLKQPLDWAIYLAILESLMMERSLARGLFDDESKTVKKWIAHFHERTIPLMEYYEGKKHLLTVSGEAKPEQVTQEILTVINV